LTAHQESGLALLRSLNLKTLRADQIKLSLVGFWVFRELAEAIAYLKSGYIGATHGQLDPGIRTGRTIECYWLEIINYFKTLVTNGTVESSNSGIKTAMKRVCGFKQVGYLRIIVYLVVGRLTLSCPQ
jgi:transposase